MIRRGSRPPFPLLACAAAAMATAALAFCPPALGSTGPHSRTLRFDGRRLQAPRSWPVYRLAEHPGMCVRLDRRAVYLGAPSANQHCPANLIGRRRAILVDPSARRGRAASGSALAAAASGARSSASGAIFTGLGFDACSAPSAKTMAAWGASPYRAIGVYIGGVNRACSQPNLSPEWVSDQTIAGWHLIPTYVGLQSPTSSCSSCAKLSGAQATTQGEAAATDAVAQAAAVGIGRGSPIYFDMEAYSRTSSATAATLAFLEAWTEKLHSLGYVSGVYSSSASGIADLGDTVGSDYTPPDDLWFANWNGQQSTTDPYFPASAWANHQRIHQYQGGHNESYGGATLNIDNDYVDGATVGTAAPLAGGDDPVGALDLAGSPAPGQVRVKGWALDPDAPTQALAIRVFVGGREGADGAEEFELGPIAGGVHGGIGAKYPGAGPNHGFDASFATVRSGPQPVCVYALNTGPGADSLLGCKTVGIPVAIVLSHLRASARGVHVRVACEWPTGTACPGQFVLRTRVRVALPRHRGRPLRTRVVNRSLARRGFRLAGERAHGFLIPYSAAGRLLLSQHGHLKAQLVAAIPGGRRVRMLGLGR